MENTKLVYLDNLTSEPCEKSMKRVKLPIPKEYGGGWATGATQEEAVRNLIERVRDLIKPATDVPTFAMYDRELQATGSNSVDSVFRWKTRQRDHSGRHPVIFQQHHSSVKILLDPEQGRSSRDI